MKRCSGSRAQKFRASCSGRKTREDLWRLLDECKQACGLLGRFGERLEWVLCWLWKVDVATQRRMFPPSSVKRLCDVLGRLEKAASVFFQFNDEEIFRHIREGK